MSGGGGISVPSGQQPRNDGRSTGPHVERPKVAYPCCVHCVHLTPITHRATCRVCRQERLVQILP